jgi:transposase-like protein
MSTLSARDRWLPIVRELESSGLPVSEFARRRDVNPSTLAWWRSRFRRERDLVRSSASAFAELAVVEATASPESHVVVTLPRVAAHVRVDATTDLYLLRAVVEALC